MSINLQIDQPTSCLILNQHQLQFKAEDVALVLNGQMFQASSLNFDNNQSMVEIQFAQDLPTGNGQLNISRYVAQIYDNGFSLFLSNNSYNPSDYQSVRMLREAWKHHKHHRIHRNHRNHHRNHQNNWKAKRMWQNNPENQFKYWFNSDPQMNLKTGKNLKCINLNKKHFLIHFKLIFFHF